MGPMEAPSAVWDVHPPQEQEGMMRNRERTNTLVEGRGGGSSPSGRGDLQAGSGLLDATMLADLREHLQLTTARRSPETAERPQNPP